MILAHGSGQVPVTGYQVVLAPAGFPVTLTHPQVGPMVVVAEDQLALWCAGTEMLTTLTVRIHDAFPTEDTLGADTPPAGAVVEDVDWVVRTGGRLLAHADDYPATPIGDVDLAPRTWHLRASVTHRAEASVLDEQLMAADEASWDLDSEAAPEEEMATGPVLGPEAWLLDLWPSN